VSTRRNSPIKRIHQPDSKPLRKRKVQKPPLVSKSTRSKVNSGKVSTKNPTDFQKKGLIRKPTAFDGFKPIDAETESEKKIIPLKSNHTSIESGELPFIETKSSLASIQLSEFQQPPRSTSTPFNNTLLEIHKERPISRSTPLGLRPLGYSTPLFHFTPLEDLPNDTGTDYNYSSSLPGLVNNESPLASKMRLDCLREEINTISNKIQNNISLNGSPTFNEDSKNDLSMGDADASISGHYDDGDMKLGPNSSSSEHTIPSKSILKSKETVSPSSSEERPKKRVKIDEVASFIIPKPLKMLKRTKRRAQDDISIRSNKKVKLLQRIDSTQNYDDLLALCGEGKDPIDLILH